MDIEIGSIPYGNGYKPSECVSLALNTHPCVEPRPRSTRITPSFTDATEKTIYAI